ncbi:MAG TPA: hypothetical protein VJH03_22850 [Blastocatellia bacterium]|nr:hypothetical protein [Blastocatellia bacterium]
MVGKRWLLKRIALGGLVLALSFSATAGRVAKASKDHKAFAALSVRLSEQGGYFDSDNLISNETSYLHVLDKLRELGVGGGVYIGVGPDQNFSYIAELRPKQAIIIDIRRDNLLQHLMFKALFQQAGNRIEYLCLASGRPFPKTKGWEQRGVKELIDYIDGARPDESFFNKTLGEVRREVQKYGIMLSASDMETIEQIHRAFYSAGMDIRYSSHHRPPRSIYPTYRDLLLERDLSGRMKNYMNSEDAFQFLKRMEEQDRIIPVVGDLSGPQAMKAIGKYIAEIKEQVSAFYVSNIEFYLARQGTFDRFIENVKTFPIDKRSVIIRSYFNYSAPLHPQAEPNHFSTQLLERIEDLIKQCAVGECDSYNDVVTKNSILLR